MKPFLFILAFAFVLPGLVSGKGPKKEKAADPRLATLFLVGDSTVNATEGNVVGWGQVIAPLFDPAKVKVENNAIGGRSSRSYWREAAWKKVLENAHPGDFILLQFGHNDANPVTDPRAIGSLPGNGSETQEVKLPPAGTAETVHTYGWYLRRYIAEGRAKGATVIVCSPIPRNAWKEDHVVRNSSDYGQWAREAAIQGGAMFVPLNELIARRYDALGAARVEELFGTKDPVHTSQAGAKLNAACVVQGLKALPDCPLSDDLLGPGA